MSIKTLIVSEFKDHGVKAAQKSFKQLAKSTLGVSLGVAGLTTAFVALGKAGVKAAADDAKAMQRLNSILGNMGFASQTSQVNDFIASLEYTTGTLDDELRPAYQSFLQITKDASAAQALLSTSMDVAAGTGSDLATVSSKLTKAIAGQRKGLTTLGLGISATEAKTMSLNEVIAIANERFGGMAEAVAKTPIGQLDRLNAAFANLNETVGYGFMSGLDLTEAKTNRLIQVTNDWAAALGRVFGWAAQLVVKLTDGLDWVLVKLGLLKETANSTASFFATWNTQLEKMINQRIAEIRLQKILKAITDAQLVAERKRLAEQKKIQAEKAKEAAAAKALSDLQKKFDIDRISIYAASQKNITQQERERLTAMMTLNEVQYSDELTWQEKILASLEKLNAAQQEAAKKAADTAAAAKGINDASLSAIIEATRILSDTNMTASEKASALAKLLASLDNATLAAVAGQFGTLGVSILANSNSVTGLTKLLENLDNASLDKITSAVIGVSEAELKAKGSIDAATAAILAQATAAMQAVSALNAQASAANAAKAASDAATAAAGASSAASAKAIADAAAAAAAAAANAGAGAGNGGGGSGSSLAQLPPTGNTITVPHGAILDTGDANSGNGNGGGTVVNLTVTGSVIAQQDLVAAVGDAVNQFARVGGKLVPLG